MISWSPKADGYWPEAAVTVTGMTVEITKTEASSRDAAVARQASTLTVIPDSRPASLSFLPSKDNKMLSLCALPQTESSRFDGALRAARHSFVPAVRTVTEGTQCFPTTRTGRHERTRRVVASTSTLPHGNRTLPRRGTDNCGTLPELIVVQSR